MLLLAVVALVLVAARGQTQTNIRNPTGYEFTASTDHTLIDRYDLDILNAAGTVIQTLNIGKPTPNGTGLITGALNVQPITFGAGYSIQVRAIVGTVASDNAVSSNKFDRVPGKPGLPLLK